MSVRHIKCPLDLFNSNSICTLYYLLAWCDAGSSLNNFWQIAWDPLSLDVRFVTNHPDQPEINLDLGSLTILRSILGIFVKSWIDYTSDWPTYWVSLTSSNVESAWPWFQSFSQLELLSLSLQSGTQVILTWSSVWVFKVFFSLEN